jgi:hypothetical protein
MPPGEYGGRADLVLEVIVSSEAPAQDLIFARISLKSEHLEAV